MRFLVFLCKPQPSGCKEDLQVDKNISLKIGEVVCSGHSWGSLEALGVGVNNK